MRISMSRQGTMMKLYFLNLKLAWVYTYIALAVTVFSGVLGIMDLSVITTSIPCVFGEVTVFSAFIVWKTKVENCRKYKDVNRTEVLESEV